jgi:hypothetical protein
MKSTLTDSKPILRAVSPMQRAKHKRTYGTIMLADFQQTHFCCCTTFGNAITAHASVQHESLDQRSHLRWSFS